MLSACQDKKSAEPAKGGPPEVGVVSVSTKDAPLELELPGRLSASQIAEIRPQVSGIVVKRLFTEGATVKAGQPLYQLDAATFEAERARTAAALQKAEASLAVARSKAARDAELLKADAISRQAADDSAGLLKQGEADVAVAKAALDAARVQLDRARIAAPIAGRVEISTVTAGALVTANQTQALTTVQQLDPMQVDIVQSSAEMLTLRRQLDGSSGSRQLKIVLEDGSLHPQPGTLQVSGVTVDRGTGAVTLRATVPNPKGLLLPGMVVRAKLLAGVDSGVILVPQQGVSRSPTGDATALVVGEGNKVERRRLVLERAVGNQWLVTSGLKVGDKLIVEGLQRARPGQPVSPVPAGSAAKKKGEKAGGAASAPASAPASAASKGA
ncbi:efflux RND transporter periplasmic adaptor subunit [Roseateles asaccharophilus]|uniref:Membrane fusion protein (Multidrug efflux system) n=1 Tax=Roseateles asaccharophilus TaxID=582607 RepID=A0ABU2A484_9BURK|nr:efflux RND transporter periplasmic adaptor subunit [Roseateles asaccharophilus]MDR7331915.1 membrane fusion protein (multidrug efflux system) [Roseateles asaccharophilus]